MLRRTTVGELVKGRPIYAVHKDDSVLEAARYMTEHRIGAVPVLNGGQPAGILSERDVMTRVVAEELDPVSTNVSEVMTRKLAVLEKDSTCRDALMIMDRLHVRHLPVMADGRLVGCVSLRELQIMQMEAMEVEIEFLDDYVDKVVRW